jgi:hypothetical protein
MEPIKVFETSVDKSELDETEIAAYGLVNRMVHVADGYNGIAAWWHGWALRAAFRAGSEWQKGQ